jgi:hypothetical protein
MDLIVAIVITNGTHYIRYTDTGATKKTSDVNLAYQFSSSRDAISGMQKAKGKTKGFYVYDTSTQYVIWKWMTEEEKAEARRNKITLSMVKRDKQGKVKRKTYSEDTRKLIYLNAHGKCELCGRKILLEDMTVDHINPLSMGGEDDVENLACTCYPCNQFKGNTLPDDFMERITEIFMYQMEKKSKGILKRKIVHKVLEKVV